MKTKGFTHESTHNESKEWYTPREIFVGMAVEFDLDPCSPGADIAPRQATYFDIQAKHIVGKVNRKAVINEIQ